jgi:hypothetical protein
MRITQARKEASSGRAERILMVIGDILHHEFYFDAKFLGLLKADIIKLLKKEGFYLSI